MITYWLYDGSRVVTSVRGAPGLSRKDVITKAIESNDRVALCNRPCETPIDRHKAILRSQVRV